MTDVRPALERAATVAGYALLGAVGAAVTALAVLRLTTPLQPAVYRAVYLRLGPSDATQTAILTHYLAVGAVAASVPALVAEYAASRLSDARAVAAALCGLALTVPAFLAASLLGLASLVTALALVGVAFAAAPVALHVGANARGAVPSLAGAAPMVVLLGLLFGFGLGWGWGYTLTAHEVAAPPGGAAADLAAAPAVAGDLLAARHCETLDGDRVCHLELRGYEHERAAARFLARHGVRCPYRGGGSRGGAVVAEYRGAHYRLTCAPHGD